MEVNCVLEVGFGQMLSASQVQTFDITDHVIIENNKDVFEKLLEWKETVLSKFNPLQRKWQDVNCSQAQE